MSQGQRETLDRIARSPRGAAARRLHVQNVQVLENFVLLRLISRLMADGEVRSVD